MALLPSPSYKSEDSSHTSNWKSDSSWDHMKFILFSQVTTQGAQSVQQWFYRQVMNI